MSCRRHTTAPPIARADPRRRRRLGRLLVVGSFVASGVLLVAFVVSQLLQDKPMFDLGLLRKPTFVGGLVAAVGVSASVFSLLTYLVIYVQNVLGYSAVESGVRFLFLSGMSFVAAIIAGRLTSHVPTKCLIAPGFLVAVARAVPDARHHRHLRRGPT